jgi:hypothetical protein
MILNDLAWNILSEDEKMALSLQLGMEKSSWESGEILNRSHYKYLEIKYRAEFFLKMFTEHLEVFDELFPPYLSGNKMVLFYFRQCIELRKKPLEVMVKIQEEFGKSVTKSLLNEKIISTLKDWEKGDNAYNKTTWELVREFDRWNNFRILPKEIQEPSAFKRRIKNSYKKQIKVMINIHPLALSKLKKLYETKNTPYIYLPIITDKNPEVLRMKANKASMEIFNHLGLYTFKDKNIALEYINNIHTYVIKGKKRCKDGLDFWPRYRELIKDSFNYNEVMKISSSRKYLQLAMAKFKLL